MYLLNKVLKLDWNCLSFIIKRSISEMKNVRKMCDAPSEIERREERDKWEKASFFQEEFTISLQTSMGASFTLLVDIVVNADTSRYKFFFYFYFHPHFSLSSEKGLCREELITSLDLYAVKVKSSLKFLPPFWCVRACIIGFVSLHKHTHIVHL